jgi:hypothetical protein
MVHGMLPRSAAAAMTPAPPMQRKAILLPVITVRAVLALRSVAVLLLLRLRLLRLRLTAGDERRQPVDIALIVRTGVLRPRLKMLLLLRLIVLRLIVVLFARIIGLRLARSKGFAANLRLLALAFVIALIGTARLTGLLLVIGLTLPELLLRRGDETEIVLGVLVIIFRCNRIAGALRVTSELKILFGDVGCGSANFYVRSIGLVHSRQWILMMMMSTLAVATAHAFVLTVSHGLLFRQPPLTATALLPPLLSISPDCVGRPRRRSHCPLFVSDLDSSFNVTSSINRAASATHPAEFQYSFRARQGCARESMKFHDLSTI